MAQGPNFEIPPEMRNYAEQSVEQAKKAFDGFMTAAQQAVDHFQGHAVAAQAGAKDMHAKAISFAEQNVRSSFDFATRLSQAKTPEELMQIQSDYVKAQMETLKTQATEMGSAVKAAAATGNKA